MTPLGPQDAFIEENSFLYAVMGAMSFARTFQSRLESALAGSQSARVQAAPEASGDSATEAPLYVLLGLVSLSRTLEKAADDLCPGAPAARRDDSENPVERVSDLLR